MSAIPQEFIDFGEAVAKLAQGTGFRRLTLTMQPNFKSDWRDMVQVVWEEGRHGEDSRILTVSSTVNVRHEIKP